ncbi:MAG: hypothetical protein AUG06_08150 [Actinobacteria bacterium 13_1_20CM_2_65_11]|nr:MAG: hypothetical protein AUG06_08150 [Actinobacteria bacterium 13_1_20CM_2_65_11]
MMASRSTGARAGIPKVLVVDDDGKIVALIRAYLNRAGYQVLEAADGLSALRLMRAAEPDLVVLDVMLPELDGLAVARLAREETDIPILMLTARSGLSERIAGLESGADDYLVKPFAPSEVVARVRAILRRSRSSSSPARLQLGDLRLDLEGHVLQRGAKAIELTVVEFDLLAALVSARGAVLTRDKLMDAFNRDLEEPVLSRSIDVYVRRLRAKLGDDARRPRYIQTVRGLGYRAVRET